MDSVLTNQDTEVLPEGLVALRRDLNDSGVATCWNPLKLQHLVQQRPNLGDSRQIKNV